LANKITLSNGQVFRVQVSPGIEIEIECNCEDPTQGSSTDPTVKKPPVVLFPEGPHSGVRYLVAPHLADSLRLDQLIGDQDEIEQDTGDLVQVLVEPQHALDLQQAAVHAVLTADYEVEMRVNPRT
jgi:hypothetical protein